MGLFSISDPAYCECTFSRVWWLSNWSVYCLYSRVGLSLACSVLDPARRCLSDLALSIDCLYPKLTQPNTRVWQLHTFYLPSFIPLTICRLSYWSQVLSCRLLKLTHIDLSCPPISIHYIVPYENLMHHDCRLSIVNLYIPTQKQPIYFWTVFIF